MGLGVQLNPLNLLWIRHCSVFLPSSSVGRSVPVACPGHTHFLYDKPHVLKQSPDTESHEVYLFNTRVYYEALLGFFVEQGKMAFIPGEQGTKAKIMRGTKIKLENREHIQF